MSRQKHQKVKPLIRVCYVTDRRGDLLEVVSDEPIRFFTVTKDPARKDSVYEMTPGVGVLSFRSDDVDNWLRDDPIGHYFDHLGQPSYGSR